MKTLRFPRRAALADGRFAFALSIVAVVSAFLFGGGARADIASLVVLRPLAALICALALLTVTRDHWRGRRPLLIFSLMVIGFTAIQLIPLPASLWHALPGRDILRQVDQAAGLKNPARPFSMAPATTWNALFSLLIPLSILVPGVQLRRRDLRRLVFLVAALVVASAVLGVLQTLVGEGSRLYLYRISNEGTPVGLFSNRNHQAFFLATAYPLLVAFAGFPVRDEQSARIRLYACAFVAAALTPVLLATGSRGGVLLGVLAAASCAVLYRRAPVQKVVRRGSSPLPWQVLLVIFAIFVTASITILSAQTTGINRLMSTNSDQELRLQIWPPIAEVGKAYFPWGSGVGTFVEVFRMFEPESLLAPEYLNHAHNDLLEVWVTAGVPGLALLAALIIGIGMQARSLTRRREFRTINGLGAVVAALLLLGGFADYPLRTPSLMAYFMLAMLWLTSRDEEAKPRLPN